MKLKIFYRCSIFPSWSGYGLTSPSGKTIYKTLVHTSRSTGV